MGPYSLNPFGNEKIGFTSRFTTVSVFLDQIIVAVLPEEIAKSILGAAGLGDVGALTLGPVG